MDKRAQFPKLSIAQEVDLDTMALIWTPVFTVSLPKSSEIRFYSKAGQGLNDKHCFKKSGASLREREDLKELKPTCGAIARCRNSMSRAIQN